MPDSALSPREIQAQVRSGASVADIVHATGMDAARVEAFAVPVIAEREFIAGQARSHFARRGGETIAHRTLAQVVADRLSPRGVDPAVVQWDAWRIEGRRWAIQALWEATGSRHEALFVYDQAGRFSVADNDDASWLLGVHPPAAEPSPGEEAEPTVGLNDELALVRVVQPGAPFEDTAPIEADEAGTDTDEVDAYTEGELEEVDGVYDIVTDSTGGIDVLYDMLAGFDEDSVQIYAGLVRPDADSPAAPVVVDEQVAADEQPEPEQHSLFDETSEIAVKPAKPRRKRAHVPSWDEIVFGSPSPRKGGRDKGE